MNNTPDEGTTDQYASFKKLLYKRLNDSGWSDQVRMIVRNEIREHSDYEITDLLEAVLPRARAMVPTTVKREMLQKLKYRLLNETDYFDENH